MEESEFTVGGTARGVYSPYHSVAPQTTTNQVTRNVCAQHSLPWTILQLGFLSLDFQEMPGHFSAWMGASLSWTDTSFWSPEKWMGTSSSWIDSSLYLRDFCNFKNKSLWIRSLQLQGASTFQRKFRGNLVKKDLLEHKFWWSITFGKKKKGECSNFGCSLPAVCQGKNSSPSSERNCMHDLSRSSDCSYENKPKKFGTFDCFSYKIAFRRSWKTKAIVSVR